ncbi:PucR family transcriptional regulator [Rhodococcus sp. JS3073]|uniref:PucR family transcriptional regulator n=1 Tax=Rhodococcus sp. JS3073 TaxID=3002901 RepID=UPI00228633D9|nr:helix-turn-helix domain-containing protein [Rhodococcus sp. JS3073]WAM17876.1 helix-turn-helix domain-containing protein [Rhodococcus sp. JS3073]
MDDTTTPNAEDERLSLRGLLEEPLLASARLLSGTDALSGPVTWCLPWGEVMSRPDSLAEVAVYTRPETLSAHGRELESLVARGAGVLLVDGSAPADTVWPTGLTVVELGFPVGFTALNRLLAERALTQEAHVMRYALTVHQSLAGLLHRGAGLPMLIREVAALTSDVAVALDVRGRLLAHAGLPDAEDAGTVALLEALANALPRLEESPPARMHNVHVLRLEHPDGLFAPTTAVAGAMQLAGRYEGWIVVVVPGANPRRHDIAQHRVVVEQAGTIIGTEMLRQRSVDEAEERARGDFVQALVHGNFANDHDLRTRAALHEIDLDLHYIVFVAPGLVDRASGRPGASMVRLARYAAGVLPRPGVRSHVTVIGDVLVVIRSLISVDTPGVESEISEYAHAMSLDLETRLGQRIPVAHGRPAAGARDIGESYREARITLGIAQRLGLSGSVAYNDLRGFSVLARATDTDESRRLIRDVLGPLRASSSHADTEELLFAYLEEGGNINAAARRLRIHRNTMIAKLDRTSRLIGMDIREPENQFTLWLALRLDLLSQVQDTVNHEIVTR